jgi:hypothetical protein
MTYTATTRARQLRELTPALIRCVRWQPVPIAAAFAVLLLLARGHHLTAPSDAVDVLRAVALLLASALSFALDDPARPTMVAVPAPQRWRAGVTVLLPLLLTLLAWAAALAWVTRAAADIPVMDVSLEAATLAACALGIAAALQRWRAVTEPGYVAGPVLLIICLLLSQLPARISLVVHPGPGWADAHTRWTLLLVTALTIVVLAVRDPAARRVDYRQVVAQRRRIGSRLPLGSRFPSSIGGSSEVAELFEDNENSEIAGWLQSRSISSPQYGRTHDGQH